MTLRLIQDPEAIRHDNGADPRDPALYRTGISSARAALRNGVARRHERELDAQRVEEGRGEEGRAEEDRSEDNRDPGPR